MLRAVAKFHACITVAAVLLATTAVAQETGADGLTEVLVTGEQPGPGLWKVTRGEHTLWILGAHSPLPKDLKWRSNHVEALIAESQEVLSPVKFDIDSNIGFFRAVVLLPSLLAAAKNPGDAQLSEVVPADVYARWLTLKEKYIGRDKGVEKLRPTFAAQQLKQKAVEKVGLESEDRIWPLVTKAARKHRVKVTSLEIEIKLKIEQPRAALKKFHKTQLADGECFAKTLMALEADLADLKARANAWSIGDIDALRNLTKKDEGENCMQLLQRAILSGTLADEVGAQDTVANVKREVERAMKDAQTKWLTAAQAALVEHRTTFAVLPIRELLQPEGNLQKLRELGYEIEEP